VLQMIPREGLGRLVATDTGHEHDQDQQDAPEARECVHVEPPMTGMTSRLMASTVACAIMLSTRSRRHRYSNVTGMLMTRTGRTWLNPTAGICAKAKHRTVRPAASHLLPSTGVSRSRA